MKVKGIFSYKITAFGLAVLLIIFTNMKYNQYKNQREINKLKSDLEAQAAAQVKKNSDLKDSIAFLNSTAFKEKVAREQLNLKKDGEIVFNFSEGDKFTSSIKANESQATSNPQKWWRYLFGISQ